MQVTNASESHRVLLVEDDAELREAIGEALATHGLDVTTVEDGREALDRMREVRPDVVVLDLMMPVMDGWQFRAEQLKDPVLAKVPVVVISADASVHEKVASFGAASVLPKPISLDKLLRAVESLYPPPQQQTP